MNRIAFFILIQAVLTTYGQVNLVPNSSFEQGCQICCFEEEDFYCCEDEDWDFSLEYDRLQYNEEPEVYWQNCDDLLDFQWIRAREYFCADNWEVTLNTSRAHPLYFNGNSGCVLGVPENLYGNIEAKSGIAYVGLMAGESVKINESGTGGSASSHNSEISIKLDNKTESCNKYTVSFWAAQATNVEKDQTNLKVFLYNSSKDFKVHDGEIKVDNTNWTKYSYEFIDEDNEGYTHLRITTANSYLAKETLVFIDDVEVIANCDSDGCSRTRGCIDFSTEGNPLTTTTPFCITNLDNVEWARLRIYNNAGQSVADFQRQATNGIGTICWDGISSGGAVADATYTFRFNAENDCMQYDTEYDDDLTESLQVTVNLSGQTPPMVDNSTIIETRTPEPCCEKVITLEDIDISGDVYYQAQDEIIIGSNVTVTSGSTVDFVAGQSIEEIGEVVVEEGAEVSRWYEECPEMRKSQNVKSDNSSNELINYQNTIRIYPSPTSGTFTIDGIGSNATIEIVDMYGRKVKKQLFDSERNRTASIDISSQYSGVYFINIITENSREVHRVTKN